MRRLSGRTKKGKTQATENDAPSNDVDDTENSIDITPSRSSKKTGKGLKSKSPKVGENGSEGKGTDSEKESEETTTSKEETDEPEEYEVESIVDMKVVHGEKQFKVRWKGYSEADDTWEFQKDLNCPELVESFLKNLEDKDVTERKSAPKKSTAKKRKQEVPKTKEDTAKLGEDDTEEEDDTEKSYEVSKIMEVHYKKDGKREFLIHWKGYSHSKDTWEPEEHLNCEELIAEFTAKLEKTKELNIHELRTNRSHTDRYAEKHSGTRHSKRNKGRERTTYHDTE